jgi:hypothetical protein
MAHPGFGHLWKQDDMSDIQIMLSTVTETASEGHKDTGASSSTVLQQFSGHSMILRIILSCSPYFMAQVSVAIALSVWLHRTKLYQQGTLRVLQCSFWSGLVWSGPTLTALLAVPHVSLHRHCDGLHRHRTASRQTKPASMQKSSTTSHCQMPATSQQPWQRLQGCTTGRSNLGPSCWLT